MLLRWAVLEFRMGNPEQAMEKAQQLIMEYPQSPNASTARKIMSQLRQRMQQQ